MAEWQHPENSYFPLEGGQLCGRVNPNAAARVGAPMRLAVDLNNMHLLNETSGLGRP